MTRRFAFCQAPMLSEVRADVHGMEADTTGSTSNVTVCRIAIDKADQTRTFLLRSYAHHDSTAADQDMEMRHLIEAERRDARLSVGDLPDIETLTGEVTSMQIELLLTIAGQEQPYIMELKKYDLAQDGGQGRVISRWMVHDLRPKN